MSKDFGTDGGSLNIADIVFFLTRECQKKGKANVPQFLKDQDLSTDEQYRAEQCLEFIMQLDIASSLAPTDSLHQLSRATVHQLLMAVLKEIEKNNSRLVKEDLDKVDTYIELLHHLGRGGITIFMDDGEPYLAISQGSDLIRAGLKGSRFGSSYASILRRHKKVQTAQTQRRCVYVAGVRTRFITFKLFDLFPMEGENQT